eukprot:6474149-Amphidinium_carterae.2
MTRTATHCPQCIPILWEGIFTHPKDATKDALQVLLNFIHADAWVGPEGVHLTLQVRKLADKYQFPDLVHLAEERCNQTTESELDWVGMV